LVLRLSLVELGIAQDISSPLRVVEMLRGWESRPACEIMRPVSLVTQSVGLYHHPESDSGVQRVVSTVSLRNFSEGGFPRYCPSFCNAESGFYRYSWILPVNYL